MEGLRSVTDLFPVKDWRATLWSLVAPTHTSEQISTRIPSIESFRVLAIFSVILWHTHFLSSLSQFADGNFFVVLNGYLVWWMGVPYFFITAGYFFQRSVLTQGNPAAQFHRYASPLAWILLIWLCIYTVTPPDWPAEVLHQGLWQPFYAEALKNIQLLESRHLWIFIEGARPVWHLWFLPALIFSLAILTLVAIGKLQRHLALFAAGIYVLILAEESTSRNLLNAPIPLGQWIIAIPLVAMGGWLAERRESFSTTMAWSLILVGYAVAVMEGTVMNMMLHSSMQAIKGHAFLGGILFSLGIFQLALTKPQLGRSTPFPFLGQLTLGIYVAHVFVLYSITPFVWKLSDKVPLWGLLLGMMVYGATVVFVLALTRVPILKFLVERPAWRLGQIARQDQKPIDKRTSE
ncbi:MAG: acyltransferase family protein [Nitrospira sp.]|nr:acyltransferase family protein [Nitrospira sp.]